MNSLKSCVMIYPLRRTLNSLSHSPTPHQHVRALLIKTRDCSIFYPTVTINFFFNSTISLIHRFIFYQVFDHFFVIKWDLKVLNGNYRNKQLKVLTWMPFYNGKKPPAFLLFPTQDINHPFFKSSSFSSRFRSIVVV